MKKIAVVIRTFNEETNIERAIESILNATSKLDVEIILCDSRSTDLTIERSRKFPIKIVQLAEDEERSPAAGAQLGYRLSKSCFVYVMDGDMELQEGFLQCAIAALEQDSSAAGVGGLINEMNTSDLEFLARTLRDKSPNTAYVDRLNGGGLYRREAIETIGYFTDKNLHAFEELELAYRLQSAGWKQIKLKVPAVNHYGHPGSSYRLLWKRLRSGYASGLGELIRAAMFKPYRWRFVKERLFHLVVLTFLWTSATLLMLMATRWSLALLIALLPVAIMYARRRSLRLAIYSVAVWIVYTIGTARGLLSKRTEPRKEIRYRLIQEHILPPSQHSGRGDLNVIRDLVRC